MFTRETKQDAAIWNGIVTGSMTVLTAIVLMIPVSYMICSGYVSQENNLIIAMICVFFGGLLWARILQKKRGGETVKYLLASTASLAMILILLTMTITKNSMHLMSLLPGIASGSAGILIGASVKINKKYRARRRRKAKYNK